MRKTEELYDMVLHPSLGLSKRQSCLNILIKEAYHKGFREGLDCALTVLKGIKQAHNNYCEGDNVKEEMVDFCIEKIEQVRGVKRVVTGKEVKFYINGEEVVYALSPTVVVNKEGE
jgi:hypothetical protein